MTCKPLRLSHSAATRYSECPKSYFYHYQQRLRQDVQSSALLFGTAVDRASEHYALTKDFAATIEVFNTSWQNQTINGKDEDLRFLLNFTYSNRDLDTDLLKPEDWKILQESIATDKNIIEEILKEVVYNKSSVGYANLEDGDKALFNYANWLCLKRKGYLMLKEFKRVFDAEVTEVLGTQVKVDLINENGDSVIGFIDLIVRMKGFNKPVVLDVKTAGREYEDDAVSKSPQLSLYVYAVSEKYENTRTCGFLVLNKNIQKNKHKKCADCGKDGTGQRHKTCDATLDTGRCGGEWIETIYPRANSQLIIQEVQEILVGRVIENFDEISKAIKAEVFPRSWGSCVKFNGAVICSFHSLCHQNSMEGLTVKKEEQ